MGTRGIGAAKPIGGREVDEEAVTRAELLGFIAAILAAISARFWATRAAAESYKSC